MAQITHDQPLKAPFLSDKSLLRAKTEEFTPFAVNSFGEILDNSPCNIKLDARYLFRLSIKTSPVAMRVYMLLLTKITSNEYALPCTIKDLKRDLNHSENNCLVQIALKELEREKAIFRRKGDYNNIYINPLFAWTGDRVSYFEASTLPLLPEED